MPLLLVYWLFAEYILKVLIGALQKSVPGLVVIDIIFIDKNIWTFFLFVVGVVFLQILVHFVPLSFNSLLYFVSFVEVFAEL